MISFDKKKPKQENDSLKIMTTFEELDQIMSQSEFKKVWEKVRLNIKNGEMVPELENEFRKIRPEEIIEEEEDIFKEDNDNFIDDNDDDDVILGASSESCLLSKEKTTEILEREYNIIDNNPTEEIRFIVGKCHPVVLIPGMLATKLQVRINCEQLYEEEKDIFKKIRFYCGEDICSDPKNNPYEEHDLLMSAIGSFQLLVLGDTNKYSACLGYFLTFFNNKDACSPYEEEGDDKYVCNYSKNIKIGYYGSINKSKDDGKCGLNAIQNLIMISQIEFFEEKANIGATKYYKNLIQKLQQKGYKPGFSLGGVPNDYRKFIANNVFTTNAIRYQIEELYKNTGKTVIVISHSYGANTMYSNLIKEENKDLLPKIKKFVAVGPPFAGSTELVKRFFSGQSVYKMSFVYMGFSIDANFDEFGWGMIINKLPTAVELRPSPMVGTLLNSPEYKEFGDAIKERLFLEKECGHRKCDEDFIKKYSIKFDSLFKDYFPSLTEPICKFENIIAKNTQYFNRKCISEMYNIAECPIIIEEKKDASGNLPNDFEKYCGKNGYDNVYYQQECNNNNGRKCLDETYNTKIFYPFKESEKTSFFIDNWAKNFYDKLYGGIDGINEFPSRYQYESFPRKQIEYHNKISLTKSMKTPEVDIDIVYSSYNPTVAAFIYNEDDYSTGSNEYYSGGDGAVSNWSPIITGLKWIYDTKKNNLKNNIRLIEFCSRLGKNTKYAYDAKKEQKFAALSCSCINNNNNYINSVSCSHGMMIADPHFLNYILTVINDPKEENIFTEEKKMAIESFDSNTNYENKCNEKLLELFDLDI